MFLSRGAKSQLGTNLELVLSHLDWLHKICQEQEDLSCKFRAFFLMIRHNNRLTALLKQFVSRNITDY